MSQDPTGQAEPGSTVTIYVSEGPEPEPEPDPDPATDPEPATDPNTDSGNSEEEWAPGL